MLWFLSELRRNGAGRALLTMTEVDLEFLLAITDEDDVQLAVG